MTNYWEDKKKILERVEELSPRNFLQQGHQHAQTKVGRMEEFTITGMGHLCVQEHQNPHMEERRGQPGEMV